jgi:hypothetical protein
VLGRVGLGWRTEMAEWGMGDGDGDAPVASRHVAAELPFPSLPVLLSVSLFSLAPSSPRLSSRPSIRPSRRPSRRPLLRPSPLAAHAGAMTSRP